MTRVDIAPEVDSELSRLADELAVFSKKKAIKLIEDYLAVLEQLRDFPESGQQSRRDPSKRLIRRGGFRFIYDYTPGTGAILLSILPGRAQRTLP